MVCHFESTAASKGQIASVLSNNILVDILVDFGLVLIVVLSLDFSHSHY